VFEITVLSLPSGAVVSIVGDIDLATIPEFRSEVLRAMDLFGPSLVFDFSGVDVFDTVALGVVLEAVKRSRSRGGSVAIADPSPSVQSDFDATRVSEILPLFPSVDDAFDSMNSASESNTVK